MTEYPYDPELPYILVQRKTNDEEVAPIGSINARFRNEFAAHDWASGFSHGFVEVIDTTPAPKIPADAEFIFWYYDEVTPSYARRFGNPANKVWETDGGTRVTEDELTEKNWIGDAEVVVLKRA